ncbi:N(G),N(G)-dimethylarginine dimethylaminohydrolase 1-like [Antedon mediterranea]|uniref:N(G),N(G)-dimethylarginine dimethylaminohydrolase 1-like n=1 Tax=Antedon mediterranea TaxID=105859 RepID=UPI003AF904DC
MAESLKKHETCFNGVVACLVRGIADNCSKDALRTSTNSVVDMKNAHTQNEEYLKLMRKLDLEIHEVPVDHNLPDCCFIEDTAVVQAGVAFICRPAMESRRPELSEVIKVLKSSLGVKIVEINDDDAIIEGGDVLFTGREFFVGLTSRTNMAGINQLSMAFPDYRVTPIEMSNDYLHLKSCTTMAGPDVVVIANSKDGISVKKQMMEKAVHVYRYLTIPDAKAANCLYINGTLIHCSQDEYPESYKVYQKEFPDCPKLTLPNSEFEKIDGAFTCRSILISSDCSLLS